MIKPEVKVVGTGKTVATFGLVIKSPQEDKEAKQKAEDAEYGAKVKKRIILLV